MTKAKKTTKSLKKKTDEKNVATVIGVEKPNKHHSYFKVVVDEKSGATSIKIEDGKNLFFMGTHDSGLINNTIHQVASVCSRGEGWSSERVNATNAALASIIEIDPQDSTELMLATQMAAVHTMAMSMASRTMLSDQSVDGVNFNVNRVTKLMRTFTTQMEALNKYRTKGQQKITVQHVNVKDGGQAIVGDVNQGGGNE